MKDTPYLYFFRFNIRSDNDVRESHFVMGIKIRNGSLNKSDCSGDKGGIEN